MTPADSARNVLLVEDNPGDALLVTELLEGSDGDAENIVHVQTLADAATRLRALEVDAVLLDLHLPDGSGVECVTAIRARAEDVPIVVLTGVDDDELALHCIRAGAQDYLSKPGLRGTNLRRALGYAIARVRESAERRRADALHQRLAAIVETSPDAIVSTTVDDYVTTWNRGAEKTFGYSRVDAVGRPSKDIIRVEASPGDPPQSGPTELTCTRADGRRVELSVSRCVLRDENGVPVARAAIYRDITEHKRLETQLVLSDRMVTIGTLAAGVAHEINNPLAAVIANIEIALMTLRDTGSANEPVREALEDAREAADRVHRIVRDLRVFSRPQEEAPGPVDVHRVIESSLRMARNEIRHRARVVRDYGTPPLAFANASRLGQVVINLLVNAAQAIEPGNRDGNEVRIRTGRNSSGRVTIDIEDTGVGIPAEDRPRLFTPFFTTKPAGTGTGLGLAICHRIVTSFGGEIDLESSVGEGTRVHVALPPATPAETDQPVTGGIETRPDDAEPVSSTRRGRILVVDDDAMILKTVERILSPDHDVDCMVDAALALERLRRGERYDLIVCDMMMPQVTGPEFYRAVARMNEMQSKRILFLTGGAFTSSARAFLDSVPNPYLGKPFSIERLRAIVADRVPAIER